MGYELDVLIDAPLNDEVWLGRCYADAPEIDGNVLVSGPGIKAGDLLPVVLEARQDYDWLGTYAPDDVAE